MNQLKERTTTIIMVLAAGLLFAGSSWLEKINNANATDQESYKGLNCTLKSVNDGGKIELANMAGKKYVLQVFAPWCRFCVQAHPMLMQVKDELPMYALAFKSDEAQVRDWLKSHGDPFVFVGIDDNSDCLRKLHVEAVPKTFIIDEEGRVIFSASTTELTKDALIRAFNNSKATVVSKDDNRHS